MVSKINLAPPSRRESGDTPVMAQYKSIKQQHPDCLLFFRMGDFFELFFEDALTASQALNIALTQRGKSNGADIPMCGVPLHAADAYLAKLVRQGFHIAVCDQLEEPSNKVGKGPLKRGVVRIITPGTLTEESLLEGKYHNFLMALSPQISLRESHKSISVALVDISTGEFWIERRLLSQVHETLERLEPQEIILPESLYQHETFTALRAEWKKKLTPLADVRFNKDNSHKRLLDFYKVATLESFGVFKPEDIQAAGALVDYIALTQCQHKLPFLERPRFIEEGTFLEMDSFTRRSLELTQTLSGERHGSFLHMLDQTLTAQGGRLLAVSLAFPLANAVDIHMRLEAVSFLVTNSIVIHQLRDLLQRFPDIERALGRLKAGRGSPRDLGLLRQALGLMPQIHQLFQQTQAYPELLQSCLSKLGLHQNLYTLLQVSLREQLPLTAREGDIFSCGYCSRLDQLRLWRDEEKNIIQDLQKRYIEATGINTLKIRFHTVLGYVIEVTKQNISKIPFHFIHRQTLTQAARYTTPELMEMEKVLSTATDETLRHEIELFEALVQKIDIEHETLRASTGALALLDLISCWAFQAVTYNYTCPKVEMANDCESFLDIQGGRHPVVERSVKRHQENMFQPNTCHLTHDQSLWLLTGPNMSGKSTFLRQNALIVLMAHIGSFVPANSAHMTVVDRLFSRVGAADDLVKGQSTFMVEMIETATILNQATSKSFVILDEIGRGTATYDGLALAWACVEYFLTLKCRTLFATHYHELTDLEKTSIGLACHTLRVKEWDGMILFMHEVIPGAAQRSYGIYVARLAGFPSNVLKRAQYILEDLEKKQT